MKKAFIQTGLTPLLIGAQLGGAPASSTLQVPARASPRSSPRPSPKPSPRPSPRSTPKGIRKGIQALFTPRHGSPKSKPKEKMGSSASTQSEATTKDPVPFQRETPPGSASKPSFVASRVSSEASVRTARSSGDGASTPKQVTPHLAKSRSGKESPASVEFVPKKKKENNRMMAQEETTITSITDDEEWTPVEYLPERLKELDYYAVNSPSSCHESIETLASYLLKCPSQGTLPEKDKVRLIFRWITNNICYAAEEVYGEGGDVAKVTADPNEILKTGKGACSGYSALFNNLAQRLGVESCSISGYSKGFSWTPGKKFNPNEKTDHAWTAVRIQGKWYLLDATWATGFLDNDLKFNWLLDEHYFLTDPNKFIFDHFPISKYQEQDGRWSTWQLLSESINLGEFNHLPKVTSTFFKLGVNVSELVGEMVVQEETSFFLTSEEPLEMSVRFYDQKTDKSYPDHVFMELKKRYKEASFRVSAPHTGVFLLRVYGKRRGDPLTKDPVNMLTYILRCFESVDAAVNPPAKFPVHSGAWGPNPTFDSLGLALLDIDGAAIETDAKTGMAEVRVRVKRDVVFTHSLEPAKDVHFPPSIDLAQQVFAQHAEKDVSSFLVRPPVPGYYKLNLFGKKSENPNPKFPQIVSLLVHANQVTRKQDVRPFPCTYQGWSRGCRLLAPLEGILQPETTYDCSLICTQAHAVMVSTELDTYFMEKIDIEQLQKKIQISNVDEKHLWHCQINSGPSGGAVSVFVQTDPDVEDFTGFLDYRVL